MSVDLPDHAAVVADLRLLREKGVLKARTLPLPALAALAGMSDGRGGARQRGGDPVAIERLLREAVSRLGDEPPGRAVQYLFGFVQGTMGRRPTDLRERAATELDQRPETFRKGAERLLLSRVADEILMLVAAAEDALREEPAPVPDDPAPPAPGGPGGRSLPCAVSAPPQTEESDWLMGALRDLDALAERDVPCEERTFGPFRVPCGTGRQASITVWLGGVEALRDVDLIVSPANVYLEPSRTFAATFAGRVRRAAAIRGEDGAIERDVVQEELAAWVSAHGSRGGPVEPGCVVVTGSGAWRARGVRHVLHAAVASPRDDGRYEVGGDAVLVAVRRAFAAARRLRAEEKEIDSICFPLLGAGRGGMRAEDSLAWCMAGLLRELRSDPTWEVHLSTYTTAEARVVLTGLARVAAR